MSGIIFNSPVTRTCINIFYKVPVTTVKNNPKQICYNFGNGEVCVNGNSYEITHTTEGFRGGQCTNNYYIDVHIKRVIDGAFDINSIQYGGVWRGKIMGITKVLRIANDYIGNGQYADQYTFYLTTESGNRVDKIGDFYPSVGEIAEIIRTYREDGTSIDNDVSQCGNSVNYTESYILKIKNSDNQITNTITGSTNPSVRIKEAESSKICNYSGSYTFARQDIIEPYEDITIQKTIVNNNYRVTMFIRNLGTAIIRNVPIVGARAILYKESDCGYPLIKIEVCNNEKKKKPTEEKTKKPRQPKKPDDKCPPGTCFECINGDFKCCYDSKLNLIKSILL